MNTLMTVEQTSLYLQVSPRTVYNLAKKGELPVVHIGESLRFRKEDIDRKIGTTASVVEYFLLIENSIPVSNLVKRTLEKEGHLVVTTSSIQEAFEIMNDVKFDHILLDSELPDMDILKTLGTIKKTNPGVPISVMVAFHDGGPTLDAKQLGVGNIITKPFTPHDIKTAMSNDRK